VGLDVAGVVMKGLLYLLVLGVVLAIADLVFIGHLAGRNRRRVAR
jgi:hypothetical protein